MLKIIHIAAGTLLSITPMPLDDPNYTIVYLDPPPPSAFLVEQLPSFHFLPGAPLGVSYENVSVWTTTFTPNRWRSSDDLNCSDIPARNITDLGTDPNRLDGDGDGIGCED